MCSKRNSPGTIVSSSLCSLDGAGHQHCLSQRSSCDQSVPIQPQIPIKVHITQPRQKLHVISSREHSLNILTGIRRCRRNHQPLLRQQAIKNFPQRIHAEFTHASVAVVRSNIFKRRNKDTELLDYRGAWKGFVVDAKLIVLQQLDRQDCGTWNGTEGELMVGSVMSGSR